MKITVYPPRHDDPAVAAAMRELLEAVDDEFVPPLSARSMSRELDAYFRPLLEQFRVGCWSGPVLTGLLTFRLHHDAPILADLGDVAHVTTVAVAPKWRGCGIGRALYKSLFAHPAILAADAITTRTWSTNEVHNALLDQMGFDEYARLPDDRGAGVDTVYYRRLNRRR
jgi:ribosomal protein S18 acetylase RimI-like enzyme